MSKIEFLPDDADQFGRTPPVPLWKRLIEVMDHNYYGHGVDKSGPLGNFEVYSMVNRIHITKRIRSLEAHVKRVLCIAHFWRDAGHAMIRGDVYSSKQLREFVKDYFDDLTPEHILRLHQIADAIDPTWREREEADLVTIANKIKGSCPSCGSTETEITKTHGFCRECTFNWHPDNPDGALDQAVAIQAEMDDRDEADR